MKIDEEILKLFSLQPYVLISNLPISEEMKYPDSLLYHAICINVGKKPIGSEKCFFCEKLNIDWCWNCERPICREHAYLVFLPLGGLFCICKDCREDILKDERFSKRFFVVKKEVAQNV